MLVRPIVKADQLKFRQSVSTGPLAQSAQDLHEMMESLYRDEMVPHMQAKEALCGTKVHTLLTVDGRPAAEVVHEVCTALVDTLAACMETALQVCKTKPRGHTGKHMQPRGVGRKRRALAHQYKAVVEMQQRAAQDGQARCASSLGALAVSTSDPRAALEVAARLASRTGPASDALGKEGRRMRAEMRILDAAHREACKEADTQAQRRLWQSDPKRAHQQIFGPPQTLEGTLDALMDGSSVTMDPERLLAIAHTFFTTLLTAPKPKAPSLEAVLQAAAQEEKVWAKDGMKLETLATRLRQRPWLHNAMADEKEFYTCLGALGCGKATGMDGIPTELLRMLPEPLKQATHRIFLLIWLTGVIPDSWKESETCLLFKGKGSQLHLKFYRPITLEKALYKAFTALATRVLSDYAEEHSILCEGQAGGRRFRSTTQVVDMLTMACEDARAFKKDLFALLIDFTAAFNTLDQDDMLAIMFALGIPCDALSVVHAMYTGATTVVAITAGRTAPIPVQRGTLQGNIMSPLLFNLYMAPLMRWLQFGALGYKFGCLENDQPAFAAGAFLDDLTALTSSISALHTQAEKVTIFGNRYHIDSNAEKSVVAAVLHARAEGTKELSRAALHTLVHAHNAAAQEAANTAAGTPTAPLKSVVELQGRKVTYVPPTSPFKLLGVHMTMTLDWTHARRHITETLVDKLRSLGASYLTPSQKLRVLDTNVRPALAYHMSMTPCAPQFLGKLDAIMGRFVKKTLGLARCVPTAMLREEHTHFGIGCPSLTAEYAAACAKGLVDALQDPTLRGTVSKKLLSKQAACLAGLDPHSCGNELNYCLRARQLSVLHKSDMALWLGDEEQFPPLVSDLWAKTDELETRLKSLPALHRLVRLPRVTDLRQLLNAQGTHVLSARELAQVTGRALPRGARMALLQFTRALCCEENKSTSRQERPTTDLPAESRSVLPKWRIETRCPAYLTTDQQAGARQRTIEDCFALLTARGQPQEQPPAQEGEAQADGQPPNAQPSDEMEAEAADAGEGAARAEHEHKRRRGDRHRIPCTHRPRGNETRQEMRLHALHTPPAVPVTSSQLTTSLTRATLAEALEARQLRKLKKSERTSPPHLKTVAGEVACALYNNNLVVAAVHAMQQVKRPPKNKRDTAPRPSQMQMLVEWRPTLIDAWARSLVERAGYTIQSETPVCRAEIHADPTHPLRQQVQCELCCGRHGGTQGLQWCNGCHRCYHMTCLGLPHPPHVPEGSGEWECPACADQQRREGDDPGLVLVEWGREWHPLGRDEQNPAPTFDSPEGRAALAAWAAAGEEPAAAPPAAADAGMDNLARQQPERAPWRTTRGGEIRSKVKLHVAPVNPQADIHPTGSHAVVIRDTDTWQGDGRPHGRHTLACVYNPDGRLVGTLGVDALAILKQRFDRAAEQGKHAGMDPPVGPFEMEVAELLCRNKEGHKFKAAAGKTCQVHWATSPSAPRYLLDGLVQVLGLTKERFASPLDVHHSVGHYSSAHARDAVFGADHDAFATTWTGWSWCHPPHCTSTLDKAVAWAAASARVAQTQHSGNGGFTGLLLGCYWRHIY